MINNQSGNTSLFCVIIIKLLLLLCFRETFRKVATLYKVRRVEHIQGSSKSYGRHKTSRVDSKYEDASVEQQCHN
jgi:hypothetical protein